MERERSYLDLLQLQEEDDSEAGFRLLLSCNKNKVWKKGLASCSCKKKKSKTNGMNCDDGDDEGRG